MPAVDVELVGPLTAITDTLLKRPGAVTMLSIKKLSEMYGFTTFIEHMKEEGKESRPLIRISISGLVLLIDIDFEVPADYVGNLGQPLSPSSSSNLGSLGNLATLGNECIVGVSISSAIRPDTIDGESYDFLFGFGGFPSCQEVLLRNLKEKTLDSFNMNLRVLILFDRLSKSKPHDLFTLFSTLACGLTKELEYEKKSMDVPLVLDDTQRQLDWDDGVLGIGKVLCNCNDKVGVFLKYWVDERYVNRWIRENKGLDVAEREYMIHFKVKESLKAKRSFINSGPADEDAALGDAAAEEVNGGGTDAEAGDNDNEGHVEPAEHLDGNGDLDMDDAMERSAAGAKHSSTEDASGHGGFFFDPEEGVWRVDDAGVRNNLSVVQLELCPPVWVPEDLMRIHGLEYEVIDRGNENWGHNKQGGDDARDTELDALYDTLNDDASNGSVTVSAPVPLHLHFLVGCKMVRLFKLHLCGLNQLRSVVEALRSWCLANSMLRSTLSGSALTTDPSPSQKDSDVDLMEVFANPQPCSPSPTAAPSPSPSISFSIDGLGKCDYTLRGNPTVLELH